MESSGTKGLVAGAVCACLAALAGCSSPQPRDFTGAWQPVNRYALTAERIPLRPAYVFEASPLDGTLRRMLARWATDAHLQLDYRLPYDLALDRRVAGLRSERVEEAVGALDVLIASERASVVLAGATIVVEPRANAVAADGPDPSIASPVAGGGTPPHAKDP